MTDKLRQAAEMVLEALRNAYDASLNGDSKGCQWIVHEQITALRQALDQLPNITKMMTLIPSEWAGLDEPPNSTTDVVKPEPFGWLFKQADGDLYKLLRGEDAKWHEKNNPSWIKVSPLYTAPPKPDLLTQTCCECGRSGGYALYCGECWGKATKREWQGLTHDEVNSLELPDSPTVFEFVQFIEAKLKEKNGG